MSVNHETQLNHGIIVYLRSQTLGRPPIGIRRLEQASNAFRHDSGKLGIGAHHDRRAPFTKPPIVLVAGRWAEKIA